MTNTNLRLKITLAVLATAALMAVVFGMFLYPFEANRRQTRMIQIQTLIEAVYEQNRVMLANELFADQREAMAATVDTILQVKGIEGVTLYGPDGGMRFSTDAFPRSVLSERERRRLDRGRQITRLDTPDGPKLSFQTAVKELGEKTGYIDIKYDLSGTIAEFRSVVLFFIALLVSTVVVMVWGLNYLLTRWVINPVSALRDAMGRVQHGELGGRVHLSSQDEIGQMAGAFNDMSAQLKETHQALTDALEAQDSYAVKLQDSYDELARVNAGLESAIEERTRALSRSNEQLKAEIEERTRAETDLARQKDRLDVIMGSLSEGVVAVDRQDRVISLNRAAQNMLGVDEARALDRPIDRLLDPLTDVDGNRPDWGALMRDGGRFNPDTALRLTDPDDANDRILSLTAAPIRDPEQGGGGSVLVFRDVTLQHKREQDAQRSAKLESLGVLAGGIAHDFNNILTAVLGNLSLAKTYVGTDDKAHQKIQEAEKATIHAKGLTRQLLTFSKGGAPITTVASVADLLVDTVNFALSGSKVKCGFSVADDLWPARIDTSQISQVINNLTINAVQAMPDGGRIDVAADNVDLDAHPSGRPLTPGRHIRIRITDYGHGIPDETLAKIFDPYFTTKDQGTGLGLSTSYSIVQNHGGHIDARSEIGRQTTFTLYLPAADGAPVEAADSTPVSGRGRILVMDDEEYVLEVTSEALTVLGYEVDTAPDGLETLKRYTAARTDGRPYAAVIMDLTVPGGMGGRETVAKLQEIDPQVKAVVSSGYFQDSIMADYQKYGFADVLPKPFRIEELSRVLGRVLGARDGSDQG
jgi:PAS domain S-box-containing protein